MSRYGSRLRVPPMFVQICMCTSMWIKRLGCHAGHQEVNRCHTRGETEEFGNILAFRWWSTQLRSGGSGGGGRHDPKCSQFHAFLENFGKIVGWRPKTAWNWKNSDPQGGVSLAPPLRSATEDHSDGVLKRITSKTGKHRYSLSYLVYWNFKTILFTAFEYGFRNCRGNRSHDFYDPVYPVIAEYSHVG